MYRDDANGSGNPANAHTNGHWNPVNANAHGHRSPAYANSTGGSRFCGESHAQHFEGSFEDQANRHFPQEDRGRVPGTVQGQNLGHNSKKAAMGPNTKR